MRPPQGKNKLKFVLSANVYIRTDTDRKNVPAVTIMCDFIFVRIYLKE